MCGIAATICRENNDVATSNTSQILKLQLHRGPDGQGIWNSGNGRISIGHNRLAIIETSPIGAQPWMEHDPQIILSWNGEIYNYLELRDELVKEGIVFQSKTDTEVISKGYLIWGESLFSKLKGMFAIIIFDQKKDALLFARDRLGIKPLYYARKFDFIAFGSEVKSLRKLSHEFSTINSDMENLFLSNGSVIYKDQTFYKNIFAVEPGYYGIVDCKTLKMEFCKYWDLELENSKYINLDTYDLRASFADVVAMHMRSDVPICTSLSGGLDSTIITATVSTDTKQKIETFSVVWPDQPELNEAIWVEEVVKYFNLNNIQVTLEIGEFQQLVDAVLNIQDEPFASSTVLAQYVLYRKISEHNFKVVLDGQGADEVFLGYQSLVPLLMRHKIRYLHLWDFACNLINLYKFRLDMSVDFAWLKNFLKTILTPRKYLRRISGYKNLNELDSLRLHLIKDGNLESLLKYLDRNSMAFSIEARVPFLDHTLVERVFNSDPDLSLKNGKLKNQLREAFKDLIPEAIYNRRSKLGYTTPETYWLQNLNLENPTYLKQHQIGSSDWRRFIVSKWREMLENEKI